MATDGRQNLVMPGQPRYQPKELRSFFGYDLLYLTVAEVELAVLEVLYEIRIIPKNEFVQLTPAVIELVRAIPTTTVDRIEREITKHDVRAWIREAQRIIGPPLNRWVHIPLTSFDPLDTGRILQFVRAYSQAIRPALLKTVGILAELVERFADQIQTGRTHGQPALPITVGFWLATILSRLLYNMQQSDACCGQLAGKISGAVGAYNAQVGLGIAERCGDKSFEQRVLGKLGLQPARISTQILPPEPVANFLFACCLISATLGQLGRDCRHLMRGEIGEIAEDFAPGQVGSSTMPHKRNPIHFEQLEGMWLRTKSEFGKVMDWLISEHQRDLVGSSLARDFPIILINLQQQLNTLLRANTAGVPFLLRMKVDVDACHANFARNAHLVMAEPLYIALQMAGFTADAHQLVNERLVPKAQQLGCSLLSVARALAEEDDAISQALSAIPPELLERLECPERYVGEAPQRARQIVRAARQFLAQPGNCP